MSLQIWMVKNILSTSACCNGNLVYIFKINTYCLFCIKKSLSSVWCTRTFFSLCMGIWCLFHGKNNSHAFSILLNSNHAMAMGFVVALIYELFTHILTYRTRLPRLLTRRVSRAYNFILYNLPQLNEWIKFAADNIRTMVNFSESSVALAYLVR